MKCIHSEVINYFQSHKSHRKNFLHKILLISPYYSSKLKSMSSDKLDDMFHLDSSFIR